MQLPSLLLEQFQSLGQDHIFQYWGALDDKERQHLLFQVQKIDLKSLQVLLENLSHLNFRDSLSETLEPPERVPHYQNGGSLEAWKAAKAIGEDIIRSQKVVALTVAGGQATRLGGLLPKGLLGVSPCRQKSLFQLFAEKLKATEIRYGVSIPWLIMTSPFNRQPTEAFFHDNGFFGLKEIHFFEQKFLPVLSQDGKLLLETPCTLSMNPNGHGGVFEALLKTGLLKRFQAQEYQYMSYFQVDNPLVHCVDPYFLGFHSVSQSSFSTKVLAKAYPEEKVGVFCKKQGRLQVIEYSHFPKEKAAEKDTKGQLQYRWSNTAIHILNLDFMEQMGLKGETCLPYRHALKAVPVYDEETCNKKVEAIKFERFIFDALEYAHQPLLLEVLREEEFSPIKNYSGKDSLETAQQDQVRLFKQWLLKAGIAELVLKDIHDLEISPLFADTEDVFLKKWNTIPRKPCISDCFYLE